LFFPYPENPVARRMCVTQCPGLLTDDLRVARGLGLVENFGGADAGQDGSARESGSVVVAGAEEIIPNCFFSKQRPCYYPSYPTADFLGKCVPIPPTNLSAAQVMGFPGNDSLSLGVGIYGVASGAAG